MREYQFRENLIRSLKNQIQEKETKIQEIDTKLTESKTIINECISTFTQSSSKVSSSLVDALNSILAGNYIYSAKETEEEAKATESNEAEAMEEEVEEPIDGLPVQNSFFGATEVNDHISVVSLETDIGLSLVYSTHTDIILNHFVEIDSGEDILNDIQLLGIKLVHDVYQ